MQPSQVCIQGKVKLILYWLQECFLFSSTENVLQFPLNFPEDIKNRKYEMNVERSKKEKLNSISQMRRKRKPLVYFLWGGIVKGQRLFSRDVEFSISSPALISPGLSLIERLCISKLYFYLVKQILQSSSNATKLDNLLIVNLVLRFSSFFLIPIELISMGFVLCSLHAWFITISSGYLLYI